MGSVKQAIGNWGTGERIVAGASALLIAGGSVMTANNLYGSDETAVGRTETRVGNAFNDIPWLGDTPATTEAAAYPTLPPPTTYAAPVVDQIAAGSAGVPCAPGEKVVSVDTDQPWVNVSIDDGPSAATTLENSRIARERGQTITFFFVANRLQTPEGLAVAQQVLADGHEIGVHSLRHILNDADANAADHDAANQVFQDTLGFVPYAYRAPGLAYSDALNQEVAEAGQCHIHVSPGADTNDWKFDFDAPEVALAGIQENVNGLDLEPGKIILMHDEYTDGVENGGRHRPRTTSNAELTYLLDALAAQGLQSVSTSDLLLSGVHINEV
ncbi:MAG: polysaccharide deacetylase family protein [Candidatus Saccharibacteria bacterium]|nr:polysaccharide deacetylase family protein [Candidatus Saccharibacteria bacterium]